MERTPLLVEVTQEGPAQKPRLSVFASRSRIAPEERTKRAIVSLLRKVLGTSEDLQGFYQLARKNAKVNLLANSFIGLKATTSDSASGMLKGALSSSASKQMTNTENPIG